MLRDEKILDGRTLPARLRSFMTAAYDNHYLRFHAIEQVVHCTEAMLKSTDAQRVEILEKSIRYRDMGLVFIERVLPPSHFEVA